MSHCSTPSDPPAVPTQKAGAGTALCVAHVVEGRAVIVRATGEIDVATAPMLGEHLRSAHDLVTAPFPIVADLAGVTFLGSAGLTVLAEQHQVCAQRGTVLL